MIISNQSFMEKEDTRRDGMQYTPYSEEAELLNMSLEKPLKQETASSKKMKMPDFSQLKSVIEKLQYPFGYAG